MKVVIVGLDGADWRLLQPWIDRGELPVLARLAAGGAAGPLRSTVRPESSVAWSSFATGVGPGVHGVFGVSRRIAGSYRTRLASGADVRALRFWDVAGGQGMRVGLLHVPFTYPPRPANGFLVSGMLTPGAHVPFTHPPALGAVLASRFGDPVFDVGEQEGDALVEDVRRLTRWQREVALSLLRERPWDLAVAVLSGPDRLQHFLWDEVDGRRPGGALLDLYRGLDDAIGEMVDLLPGDGLLLLVSDHGFCGCARRFRVNRWLVERGWLAPRRGGPGAASLVARLGASRALRRVKRALFPARWNGAGLRSTAFARAVDWPRTRAWFGPDGGVWINVRGREPEGCVPPGEAGALRDALRRELLAVRDPETGQALLADVFPREELYRGPAAGLAPDLILEPRRDGALARYNAILDSSLGPGDAAPFGSSLPYTGNHAPEGILLAWGAGVTPGRIEGARIVDLAPTVLAALGVGLPEGAAMDGRMLPEVVGGQTAALRRPPAPAAGVSSAVLPYSRADEAIIAERLANLGYLP